MNDEEGLDNLDQRPEDSGGKGGGLDVASKVGNQASKGATEEVKKQAQKKLAEEFTKKAGKKAAEQVAKVAAKKAAAQAAAHSLMAALAPILFWVFVGIVVIIIVVGLIMFFATMPGLILEKLKQLADGFLAWCTAQVGGLENVIKDEEIASTADYIESMGYDLKGYGFVSKDSEDKDKVEDKDVVLDDIQGVLRFADTGKVASISSRYIERYLTSNFYVYIIKNQNISIVAKWENLSTSQKVRDVFGTVATVGTGALAGAAIGTMICPGIGTIIGAIIGGLAAGAVSPTSFFHEVIFGGDPSYGTGLISIYEDTGTIGVRKDGSLSGKVDIYIDADSRTMSIASNRFFNKNHAMKYSLEGWTGRYGMPMEFLLSVHLATMAPDLAMEMATSFNTDVEILLHYITDANVNGGYRTDKGNIVSYEDIDKALHDGNTTDNGWDAFFAWFDDNWGGTSDKEAIALFSLGVEHTSGCGCCKHVPGKSGDSTTEESGEDTDEEESSCEEGCKGKIDGNCKDHLTDIIKALQEFNDYSYETFTPYISHVTNHWFRDVHFITNNSMDVVQTDEDYLKETKERWSLFQVYTDNKDLANYYDAEKDSKDRRFYYHQDAERDGLYVLYYTKDGTYEYTNSKSEKKTVEYNPGEIYWPEDDNVYAKEVGASEYAKEMGIPVTKKVITEKTDSGWMAYEESGEVEGEWEELIIDTSERKRYARST